MTSDQDSFLRATMGAMDLVYNLSRRLVRSREEAEDLAQDTYLAAFRAWSIGDPSGWSRGWPRSA